MVHTAKNKLLFNKINFKIKMRIGVLEMSRAIENNGCGFAKLGPFPVLSSEAHHYKDNK